MSKKKTKKLPDILHFLFQSVDLPPCSRSNHLWKILLFHKISNSFNQGATHGSVGCFGVDVCVSVCVCYDRLELVFTICVSQPFERAAAWAFGILCEKPGNEVTKCLNRRQLSDCHIFDRNQDTKYLLLVRNQVQKCDILIEMK